MERVNIITEQKTFSEGLFSFVLFLSSGYLFLSFIFFLKQFNNITKLIT